ncbi:MAG TPA: hypothetical protein VG937_03695 [Polyangiaceae bacterium]|nr:hypothetical protein [Polyangiaceae bacterium]
MERPKRSEVRWAGRLTSRPLPERDPELDALEPEQRSQLSAVWLARAASERRVADAFEVVRDALEDLGSEPRLQALAARAVDDEHRHAELARRVASRFAGRELEAPPRLTLVVPEHRGAPDRLRSSLHVLGHCAMNETFASAFLEAALGSCHAPYARAALRELLSDEVDHARIGWAHLAALRGDERAELAPWLESLVRENLKMWREAGRQYSNDPALHRHGAPSAAVAESAVLGAVSELILPGLAHFGLATHSLRRWLDEGAPTHATRGTNSSLASCVSR